MSEEDICGHLAGWRLSSFWARILLDLPGLRSDKLSCKGTKLMPQFKIPTMTRNQVAVPMSPDAELGLAMLIVEDEYGLYEPVAVAGTINEAKELLKAICADGCSGSNEARISFARLATCFGGVAERVTTALSSRSMPSTNPAQAMGCRLSWHPESSCRRRRIMSPMEAIKETPVGLDAAQSF